MSDQINELGMRRNFLEEQLQQLDFQLQELFRVKEGIEEINDLKAGQEILVPLGAGVFTKAEVKTGKLLMNVGSQIVIEKEGGDAGKLVTDQIAQLEQVKQQMVLEMTNIQQTMQMMQMQGQHQCDENCEH